MRFNTAQSDNRRIYDFIKDRCAAIHSRAKGGSWPVAPETQRAF
jgi:hypothetical protein